MTDRIKGLSYSPPGSSLPAILNACKHQALASIKVFVL
jgi:hypothetical protein